MEDTRQDLDLVHVLRHSFRPSTQLAHALEGFIPPGSERSRSFIEIKSLGMIALDAVKHAQYAYSQEIMDAQKTIEANRSHSFEVIPEIEVKKIGEKTLHILMGVQEKKLLYHLMRTTRQRIPEGVQLRDPESSEFSMYARIHSSIPITEEFRAEATERYNEMYQSMSGKHLFSVLPEGITGIDQFRQIPRIYAYEEAS
jgi:hypothetical protein